MSQHSDDGPATVAVEAPDAPGITEPSIRKRQRRIVWLRLIHDPVRSVRCNRLREYAFDRLDDHDHTLYRTDPPRTPLPPNWSYRPLPPTRSPIRRIARLSRDLLTDEYDLVVTRMLGSKPTACAVLANVIQRKDFVVMSEHWYHRRGGFRAWWFRFVLRHSRLAVAQSTRAERFLREGGARHVVRCVNTIADITTLAYDEELALYLARQPGPRILCAARLVEFKGQDILIRVFRRLSDPDLRLFLVGNDDTPFGRRCRSLAAGDPRIVFTGQIDFGCVLAYYRACDLFVLPNRFTTARVEGAESFGYAALEAAYMGLPLILTTATGCSADLIREGVTGYAVAAGDPGALQRRLESLLNQPARLPDLGRAAAHRARELCAPTATADLEAAMSKILETSV